jgi:hypothetical protein
MRRFLLGAAVGAFSIAFGMYEFLPEISDELGGTLFLGGAAFGGFVGFWLLPKRKKSRRPSGRPSREPQGDAKMTAEDIAHRQRLDARDSGAPGFKDYE